MDKLKDIGKKVEAKLGDHPNVNNDPNIQPSSGVEDVNSGHNPGKTGTQNRIEMGQGGEHEKETIRAGSFTAPDTVSAATASGVLGDNRTQK
ncbi:hypothetical protein M409DRAFT_23330 [Zasmidium cellare ATCC 36951]|uniref:Uncharacterized protein n=1 Tax=Zasmidium cellare ATCC 36951 TaxID=1080233 RepID=A0A6A6CIW3_ZASCE|nr:uncharacterized protein M409DRAFT_23330 [Zasmidium cellare ATCC 36951]KAF2166140.1 hypothetical protein M409DRAFT_23330 [Zasmidium cellare ATCC 36951]